MTTIWVQDGNDEFSIGAFYNITKNQDNPIKTVGGDLRTKFLGVTKPPGVALFDQNRIRRLRKTLHKQTNTHYENNGHLAVNQYAKNAY